MKPRGGGVVFVALDNFMRGIPFASASQFNRVEQFTLGSAHAGGKNSNPLFVGVQHVHETFNVVAVADAGLLLAHLEPGDGGGVVGERAA